MCRSRLVADRLHLPEPLRPAYDQLAELLKQVETLDWKINYYLMSEMSETPCRCFVNFLFELDALRSESAAAFDVLLREAKRLRPISSRATEALARWIDRVRSIFSKTRLSPEQWRGSQFRLLSVEQRVEEDLPWYGDLFR
jgi:hypothetical protein